MPDIAALNEPHAHSDVNPDVLAQLEEAVVMWQNHIDSTIAACLGKVS